MLLGRKRVAARYLKRSLSLLVVLAFLAGTAGIPIIKRAPKDRSQPFPCQDNPCGCSSADECWHHCCCHTNREKLEWAREHGVIPPSYVVEAAEHESEPARTCCQHGGCKNCVAKADAVDRHDDDCSSEHEAERAARPPQPNGKLHASLVLSDLARRCQGLSPLWVLVGDVLPPRIQPIYTFDDSVVGAVIDRSIPQISAEISPPVPPPKLRTLRG